MAGDPPLVNGSGRLEEGRQPMVGRDVKSAHSFVAGLSKDRATVQPTIQPPGAILPWLVIHHASTWAD